MKKSDEQQGREEASACDPDREGWRQTFDGDLVKGGRARDTELTATPDAPAAPPPQRRAERPRLAAGAVSATKTGPSWPGRARLAAEQSR